MKRFQGLLRDTWWAWGIILGFGIVGGVTLSWIFYSAIPISLFSFVYFGLLRYDEHGNIKEM